MEKNEIQVKFCNNVNHPFFGYVDKASLQVAKNRVQQKISQVVFFIVDGVEKFGAIIDIHRDCLHVREVGGSFPYMWKVLNEFCAALASAMKKKSVTFKTKIEGVKYLAKKAGFALNDQGDYERVYS